MKEILMMLAKDISREAEQLKQALSDLRQTRSKIYTKLVDDHQKASEEEEKLLKEILLKRSQVKVNFVPPWHEVGNSHHLSVIQDKLLEVVESLAFTHYYLESTGLSKRYTALFTAISDALTTTSQAVERCADQPDE